jgi:hypothetical protein
VLGSVAGDAACVGGGSKLSSGLANPSEHVGRQIGGGTVAKKRNERDYLAALQDYSRPLRDQWVFRFMDEGRYDFQCRSATPCRHG